MLAFLILIEIQLLILNGGLAQLARALDLHSRGHRFDSDILHPFFKRNNALILPEEAQVISLSSVESLPDRIWLKFC